jgi:hypothetical protein
MTKAFLPQRQFGAQLRNLVDLMVRRLRRLEARQEAPRPCGRRSPTSAAARRFATRRRNDVGHFTGLARPFGRSGSVGAAGDGESAGRPKYSALIKHPPTDAARTRASAGSATWWGHWRWIRQFRVCSPHAPHRQSALRRRAKADASATVASLLTGNPTRRT